MTDEQNALVRALDGAMHAVGCDKSDHYNDDEMIVAVNTLRDCIAVPRAEYDRLRRAVWGFMLWTGYPQWDDSHVANALVEIGFINRISGNWTPAAHEFAREMENREAEK